MTTNYKTLWKTLAAAKNIQAYHVVQYCAVKAIKAKDENKAEIFKALLKKAFTPTNEGTYPKLASAFWEARITGYFGKNLFNQVKTKDFLTEEEVLLYTQLLNEFSPKELADPSLYTFVFVRQDLTPEYQLVQAAHATCVLGKHVARPEQLHFVVVGVPDLEALEKTIFYLSKKGHEYVDFVEPDIGDERTAIATLPIRGDMRKDFKKFKLLKF